MLLQDRLERQDALRGRPPEPRALPRVERDQVDLGADALEEARQPDGVLGRLVDAIEQHVLESHPLADREREAAAGGQEILDGPALIHRHEALPHRVRRGVERDRQVDLQLFLGELLHPADQPHRRHGDPPGGVAEGAGMDQEPERLNGGLVVGQRLAHAHEDEVGDARSRVEGPAHRRQLADDLSRRQVANEAHGPGEAERAGEAASDLDGEAEGEPVPVGHEDGVDPGAVGQAKDELLAAVPGRDDALDLGNLGESLLRQPRPELLREVRHGLEVIDALLEEPDGQLATAVGVGTQTTGQRLELVGQERKQIHIGHGRPRITQEFSTNPVRPRWITLWVSASCCREIKPSERLAYPEGSGPTSSR